MVKTIKMSFIVCWKEYLVGTLYHGICIYFKFNYKLSGSCTNFVLKLKISKTLTIFINCWWIFIIFFPSSVKYFVFFINKMLVSHVTLSPSLDTEHLTWLTSTVPHFSSHLPKVKSSSAFCIVNFTPAKVQFNLNLVCTVILTIHFYTK